MPKKYSESEQKYKMDSVKYTDRDYSFKSASGDITRLIS